MPKKRGNDDSGDDSASLFFLLALLLCAVVPWTLTVIWELLFPGYRDVAREFPAKTEDGHPVRCCQTQAMASKREARIRLLRSRCRLLTRGFLFRMAILVLLWCWMAYIVVQMQRVFANSTLYQNFDPYAILELSSSSVKADIKKAYRKMSLKYHPDKDASSTASDRFMLIRKAYEALTDPIAKRNYAMYGNPDGPTSVEIGVAIPSISKEKQGLVLVLFLVFFVLGVPLTLLWYMGGSQQRGTNGILNTTMESMVNEIRNLTDTSKVKTFILRCDDTADLPRVPEEDKALAELAEQLTAAGVKFGAKGAPISKAEVLFTVHTQRRFHLLDEAFQAQMETLLIRWRAVALAIAEMAGRLGGIDQLSAALEMHKSLVQAIELQSTTPLLQVPHFDADRVKLWRKGPRKTVSDLPQFARLAAAELETGIAGLGLSSQEQADVSDFLASVPQVEIVDARVFVEGEDSICKDDIATLQITFKRQNLRDGEAVGAAHTPYFPEATVAEAWWLQFSIPPSKGTPPIRCLRILDPGHEVSVELKFKVKALGKCRCQIVLTSEAYSGLSMQQGVSFEAKQAPQGSDNEDEGGSEDSADLDD